MQFISAQRIMNMKKIATLLALTGSLLIASTASAQFAKPEDAIKYRKAAFTVMGTHFGRIAAMAQGKVAFDAKAAADNAAVVESLAKLPWAAFGAGTDLGDTKAKPEIWKDAAKFKEIADKLVADSAKLSAAAKTGNIETVKIAFAAVGGACKACHDDYKAK
jgi:cytochrome c556